MPTSLPACLPRRADARPVSGRRTRSVACAALIGVLVGGCASAADDLGAESTSVAATDVVTELAPTVAELAPAVAELVDRPVVIPEVISDPSAPELAGGAAAAAVTDGIDRAAGTATSYRIVVDAARLSGVDDLTRRALLAHELVHSHLQSVTDPATPLWLVEGFADAIGYRAAGTDRVAVRDGLGDLAPGGLPTDAELSSGDLAARQAAYGRAWLAVEYLVGELGESGAVALYRTVAVSPDPAAAFAAQLDAMLGLSEAEFVMAYDAYVAGAQ